MFRLLHLADVHLGAPLRGFGREADDRQKEVLDAFRRLPDLARDGGADAVLIAGDLFDSPQPGDRQIIAVRETVRKLAADQIPVFAIPGNHDAHVLAPDLYPSALDAATTFLDPRFGEPAVLANGDQELFVYGAAFDAAEEPDPISTFHRASREGVHVVLLHGSTPGAPHWEGGSSLQISWEALSGIDADYVALGDLHGFRGPDTTGTRACYPGSFSAVDFTEVGLRGGVWVEVGVGIEPHIERVSSGVREVAEPTSVDVSGCESDREVADRTPAPRSNGYPVVRLEGEPSFPLDVETVQEILEERHGAARVSDQSHFFDENRLREIAGQNTIAGHVARLGRARVTEASDASARDAAKRGLRLALRVMGLS